MKRNLGESSGIFGCRSLEVRLARAYCYFRMKQYDESLREAKQVLAIDPFNKKAQGIVAFCHYWQDEYVLAVEAMKIIAESDIEIDIPSEPTSQWMKGTFGKLLVSVPNLVQFIEHTPDPGYAHYIAGCQLVDEKPKLALEHCLAALTYKLDDRVKRAVLTDRGFAYANMCDYERALSDLSAVIAEYPDYDVALTNRAFTYILMNNYESALVDLMRAKALDPDDEHMRLNLALTYFHLHRFDDALREYTWLIENSSKYKTVARRNRGRIYVQTGRYSEAIAELSEDLVEYPNDEIAIFCRSIAYTASGSYEAAINDLTQLLDLSPENQIAYKLRGSLHMYLGRQDLGRSSHVKLASPESITTALSDLPFPYCEQSDSLKQLLDIVTGLLERAQKFT